MNTASELPETTAPDLSVLPPAESDHRGNGKIARLPKALRDRVNRMLDDGVPYKTIISEIEKAAEEPLPYKLLEMNISRWKDNGYQHYVRREEWRDELRIVRESGSEMTELNDGPRFQETLVQVALTEIFRVLQQRELKSDSLNFIRLFNSLARLNREALGLKKYNDLLAKEKAELTKLDIERDISKNEHRAIADRTDRIFRMPRPRPDNVPAKSEPAAVPPPTTQNTGPERSEIQNSEAEKSSTVTQPSSPPPPTNPTPEHCLDCGSILPLVPPDSRRRPDDHCPSCGVRLPDIGLCAQPGFDRCLSCGATQPHLLPSGKRPRPNCHKCGERLHNPESNPT
jgi:hypothetical protein